MRKKDLLRGHVKEKFHVTPKTGPAFTGRLVAVSDENIEFVDVVVVMSGEPAAGRLFISRDNLAYVQLLVSDATG